MALCGFFSIGNAVAQCTPDPQYTMQGVYPDTIQNLPQGMVGQAYSTVVTVVVPEDTMVTDPLPLTLTTVNFELDTIRDMPPGFNYECSPNDCVWPGNTSGCILITGPALSSNEAGTYPLDIRIKARFTSIIGPINRQGQYPGYKIVINNSIGPVGYEVINENVFALAQNIPNPAVDETKIRFTSPLPASMELNIYNSTGQLVVNKKLAAEKGLNEIPVSTAELANGMYVYTLSNGNQVLNRRMVVSH